MLLKNRQVSEAFETGAVLAVVGGFLDAYTYISRGQVFANAQTGNMVLLALKIAEKSIIGSIYYLIPILAFIFGIITAEYIRKFYKENEISKTHWRQIIILAEIFILLLISFIPSGNMNTLVNILISFVCSLQVESFRKINGNAVATTMCTGNLRSGSEFLFKFKATGNKEFLIKSIQYFGIIFFFILGSVIGIISTNLLNEKSIFICIFLLLIIFSLMFCKVES